jgi:hypothetical protein
MGEDLSGESVFFASIFIFPGKNAWGKEEKKQGQGHSPGNSGKWKTSGGKE